tara:strand:- start:669 stop:773 length:105 start_codon:yes stop_codon:yes gene_type:complete
MKVVPDLLGYLQTLPWMWIEIEFFYTISKHSKKR